jgi:catechol 2,3-dioxygenase-like lactoylglutathione lyase family enzyme
MFQFGGVIPILRSFDEARMREFYVGYLDFEIAFEHRFAANAPLYVGLKRGECELHLSEHHGDSTPGARVRIRVDGLEAYWELLSGKDYRFAKPGRPGQQPWGEREMTIADPFGNRLTFFEPEA